MFLARSLSLILRFKLRPSRWSLMSASEKSGSSACANIYWATLSRKKICNLNLRIGLYWFLLVGFQLWDMLVLVLEWRALRMVRHSEEEWLLEIMYVEVLYIQATVAEESRDSKHLQKSAPLCRKIYLTAGIKGQHSLLFQSRRLGQWANLDNNSGRKLQVLHVVLSCSTNSWHCINARQLLFIEI